MTSKSATLDERLDRIYTQLERIAMAVVKNSEHTDKKIDTIEANLKAQIDIYARAVDAYAKQAETYMQENVSTQS